MGELIKHMNKLMVIFANEISEIEIENIKELQRRPNVCSSCRSPGPSLHRCKGCRTASYCNPQCQKRDWKQHRLCCDQWKQDEPGAKDGNIKVEVEETKKQDENVPHEDNFSLVISSAEEIKTEESEIIKSEQVQTQKYDTPTMEELGKVEIIEGNEKEEKQDVDSIILD